MTNTSTITISNERLSTASSPLTRPGGGRFEALIFDMGSTLLEFDNVPWSAVYRIGVEAVYRRLQRLGHHPPEIEPFWERFNTLLDNRRKLVREEHREYRIGPLLKTLVSHNGVSLRPGELFELCNVYYAPIRRAVTVYSESHPTLAVLHAAGYRLGLLSNTAFRVVDHSEELERFGLWSFFEVAVFTSTLRHRKPHPQPFQEVARRMSVDLTRCVYIGDRQREDVLGPQGVGMTAVLVRRPHRKYEQGLTESAEIGSLSDLPQLLGVDNS